LEALHGKKVVSDLPIPSQSEAIQVPTPSKMELATQWLKSNRDDCKKSGRELESTVRPMGVKISYVYWNKAKSKFKKKRK
jgi:hypothetical protein